MSNSTKDTEDSERWEYSAEVQGHMSGSIAYAKVEPTPATVRLPSPRDSEVSVVVSADSDDVETLVALTPAEAENLARDLAEAAVDARADE